ncbi:MAG: MFS transporter [Chloroflexi bacterium]|nr:MAG: MFS transporter [Chloroflexota bacterium]MBL1194247.1 MFS transporter [Chloroflexota bacterium]NOH11540.1 BCD family MFS transporter [Chloroflexota bacterium]
MFRKRIQLGLIHVAMTITLLPINSVLNRIMIKELAISATLVAVLASLPYVFSPIQVAIGSFSDRYPILGWRRTPYIFLGLLLCVAGVIVAPQIAFLLASNFWLGVLVGVLAFGAWGMGFNFATVSYFSLATEISGEKGRSRSIAVMFFMMIVSIIATSLILSRLVESYDPAALVNAFWMVGLAALGIGLLGIIGLEERNSNEEHVPGEQHTWGQMAQAILRNRQAARFFLYLILLLTAILGQDILLEPYAAEAFGLSVESTTRITSIWGSFFLISLLLGGAMERRVSKFIQARLGAWLGIAAFALIVLSSSLLSLNIFYAGVILLGLATGLATVSNLSLMLDMTTVGSVGLFIGAWGMASALARLVGNLLSGVLRDSATQLSGDAVLGYSIVFSIEVVFLLVSLFILRQVDVSVFQSTASDQLSFSERAALANEGGA